MFSLTQIFQKLYFYVFLKKNYDVCDVKAVFEVLGETKNPGPFWGSLPLEKGTVQTVSIRGRNYEPVPENIHIHVYHIDYWFNTRIYTKLTRDPKAPLGATKGLSFGELPIKSACLCDQNDQVILDVTDVIKRFAGPKCEYGFLRTIRKLKIVDILGNQSSILAAK